MKFTICVTQRCNLRCAYCYVVKRDATMSLPVARRVVDWIFAHALPAERIDIGLFGGEPLLEFSLVQSITELIEAHPSFDLERVTLSVVSNGTLFSDEIADFLKKHSVNYCLSCDGPPGVQDRFRRFSDGRPSSPQVESTAKRALRAFGQVPVNAVYRPETFRSLPGVLDYFSSLGFRQIYFSPDFSASWSPEDADALRAVYGEVAQRYVDGYVHDDPHFISLIDSKITVLLRGGYQPLERCRMGRGEFAFSPDGGIYPCERLIGCGGDSPHRLGNVFEPLVTRVCGAASNRQVPVECRECGLKDYCMNWCGCSNFFSTGNYDRVGPFLCASERAAIAVAAEVFETLEKRLGPTFVAHLAGMPTRVSAKNY